MYVSKRSRRYLHLRAKRLECKRFHAAFKSIRSGKFKLAPIVPVSKSLGEFMTEQLADVLGSCAKCMTFAPRYAR